MEEDKFIKIIITYKKDNEKEGTRRIWFKNIRTVKNKDSGRWGVSSKDDGKLAILCTSYNSVGLTNPIEVILDELAPLLGKYKSCTQCRFAPICETVYKDSDNVKRSAVLYFTLQKNTDCPEAKRLTILARDKLIENIRFMKIDREYIRISKIKIVYPDGKEEIFDAA